jgi:hypothetical protein
MWFPVEQPWQYRVLDQLPPGIDEAQLEQARRMTPTERVEAMLRMVEIGEIIRRARLDQSGERR